MRPEQTTQKNNSSFGFGESAAIRLLLIFVRIIAGAADSRLQEAEQRCLEGQVRQHPSAQLKARDVDLRSKS